MSDLVDPDRIDFTYAGKETSESTSSIIFHRIQLNFSCFRLNCFAGLPQLCLSLAAQRPSFRLNVFHRTPGGIAMRLRTVSGSVLRLVLRPRMPKW